MRETEQGRPYPVEYRAENGFQAVCEIRIYEHESKIIVVATDLGVGPSVTNNVERIATVLREQGITWDYFFEHYFDRPEVERPETFDFVEFTWRGNLAFQPKWKAGTREKLEQLIGQTFT
jgi:hypothetical protein